MSASELKRLKETDAEHAVDVDSVDDRESDRPVPVRHGRQVQLPEQMILQTVFFRTSRFEIERFAVPGRTAVGGGIMVLPIFADRHLRAEFLFLLVHRFFKLEHGIGFEHLHHFLVQVEIGKLQEFDRLLKLRSHRQMLAELELKREFHGCDAT